MGYYEKSKGNKQERRRVVVWRNCVNLIQSSLRNKILAILLGVLIIPFSISAYVSFGIFRDMQLQDYLINTSNLLLQASQRFDTYFEGLEQLVKSVSNDAILTNVLNNFDKDKVLFQKKRKALQSYYNQTPEVHSLIFYYPTTTEGFVIGKTANVYQLFGEELTGLPWYIQAVKEKNSLQLQASHDLSEYLPSFQLNSSEQVFTISKATSFSLSANVVAVVSVNFKTDTLVNICQELLLHPEETVGLLDSRQQPFYEQSVQPFSVEQMEDIAGDPQSGGHFVYEEDGQELLVTYCRSAKTGNFLYKTIPMQQVFSLASQAKNISLLSLWVTILLVVAAVVFFFSTITRPVQELQKCMAQAGAGKLDSFIGDLSGRRDEIGQIYHSYNTMLGEINQLIREKYQIQLAHRSTMLKALQAQINPHFLNNTLQAIGSDALDENNLALYNIICRLGNMLRYSVKNNCYIIELGSELENVEDYLCLQKLRFEDKLNYRFEVDPQARNVAVPKLFLQPIVENAISHGLEPSGRNREILISVRVEWEQVIITVQDNGVGMTTEVLERVRRDLIEYEISTVTDDSIGLGNIGNRLRLLMGDRAQITVGSDAAGTCVTVTVPRQGVESFENLENPPCTK